MVCSFLRIPKSGCAGRASLCRNLSLTSRLVTFPAPVRTGFHAAGIGPTPWGISFKINLQIVSANTILCVYSNQSISQSINVPISVSISHPLSAAQMIKYSPAVRSLKGSLYFKPTSLTPLDLPPLLCFCHIWPSVTLSHTFCQKALLLTRKEAPADERQDSSCQRNHA